MSAESKVSEEGYVFNSVNGYWTGDVELDEDLRKALDETAGA